MVVEKATNPHSLTRRVQNANRPMLRFLSRWDSCREAQTNIEGSALLRAGYKNRFFTDRKGVDHPYTFTTHQTTLITTHLDPLTAHNQKWPATPLPASAPPAHASLAAASAPLVTPRYIRKVRMSFGGCS